MSIEAIIFDLDGLLVDSEPLAKQAWRMLLDRFGHTLDEATIDATFGLRLQDTARLMQDRFALPLSAPEIMAAKNQIFLALVERELHAMPGAPELLRAVQRRPLRHALATSAEPDYVPLALQAAGIDLPFEVVITGADVTRGKPEPDIYLAAARALGLPPENCLALEDSPHGVRSARAAGMRCIAVPNQITARLDLSFADWVMPSLTAVALQLDRFLQN